VLEHLITGQGTLAEIGRRYGVSRQSIHRHFRKAKAIYGQPSTAG
jgi:AcrR family transcriptional regulator